MPCGHPPGHVALEQEPGVFAWSAVGALRCIETHGCPLRFVMESHLISSVQDYTCHRQVSYMEINIAVHAVDLVDVQYKMF